MQSKIQNPESKIGLIQDRIKDLRENTDFVSTIFESLVGYAIIAADFDGNIIAYNEGAGQIYGYAPEEIIDKQNIEIFFPKDFIESGKYEKAINDLIGEGKFSYEGEKVRKNGARFPAQILFALTRNKTGKAVGFIEIVEDLTERKQAEGALLKAHDKLERRVEECTAELATANVKLQQEIKERRQFEKTLQEGEDKYSLLVMSIPGFVYKGFKDWSVEFFDNKIELLTGYNKEEFNCRKIIWSDLVVKEDIGTARESIIRALKTGKSYIREYRIRARSGEIRWVQDRGQIKFDQKGEIESVMGIFFDITERKRAEELVREQQKSILELSTPVIQVWEEILILPLIGAIDSTRALQIMENLLESIVATKSSMVVIDITGVATVDTEVANRLMLAMEAAKLMGTECILTGISPAISQAIVHLGVDLAGVITRARLKDGLELAFRKLKFKVTRTET